MKRHPPWLYWVYFSVEGGVIRIETTERYAITILMDVRNCFKDSYKYKKCTIQLRLTFIELWAANCTLTVIPWLMLANNSLGRGFDHPHFINEASGFWTDWVISKGHTASNWQRHGSDTGHQNSRSKMLNLLSTCFWFSSLCWKMDMWRHFWWDFKK